MGVSEANYHGEFSGGPGMVETTASPVIQSEAVVDKLQTLIPDIGVGVQKIESSGAVVDAVDGHVQLTAAEQRMVQARALRMEASGVGLPREIGLNGSMAEDHIPYTEEQALEDYRSGQNY